MPWLARELRDTPPAVYVRELLETCLAELAAGERARVLGRLERWHRAPEGDLMDLLPQRTYQATARLISQAYRHLARGDADIAEADLASAVDLYRAREP